ncbi:MAG: hypothetical protein ACE5PV_13935 [Candidatus Poribacteria bacterium]
MRIRRCYIPNCSASAMELVVDLHTALEEFFKLADEVKVRVIEKREDKYETLHKGTVKTPEDVIQLATRFPNARVELSIPAGWLTLKSDEEAITLAFDGVHPKTEHFTYWAPIVRHAQRIEFVYCGEPGDELPWEIESREEVQKFYAQLVPIGPYEMHRQKAEEWRKLIEELEKDMEEIDISKLFDAEAEGR